MDMYSVERVMRISAHHEIHKLRHDDETQPGLALKVAVSEEGHRRNSHEAFVLEKLQHIAGVVRLEQVTSKDSLVLSLHGESLEAKVGKDGYFRFSQVGNLLQSLLDTLASIHREGVVVQNICPRHILIDGPFPAAVLCDLSSVCKADSVAEEEQMGDNVAYLSPQVESGARSRISFIDDFWALIFTGLQLSGVPMGWFSQPGGSDSKMRFIRDAQQSALGDVPRAFQEAIALLAELEELPRLPPYDQVASRLSLCIADLSKCGQLPPVPESLLLLAQDCILPSGVFARISGNGALLAALDVTSRDVGVVRATLGKLTEYGHVIRNAIADLDEDKGVAIGKAVERNMHRDAINTAGLLYALPSARAAVCSQGPVCLFALITGSCRMQDWCPLVHPEVPVIAHNIKPRRRKICFRFIGTGSCPSGPRCDKVHPHRSDLDEWIQHGHICDLSASERKLENEYYELDAQILKTEQIQATRVHGRNARGRGGGAARPRPPPGNNWNGGKRAREGEANDVPMGNQRGRGGDFKRPRKV